MGRTKLTSKETTALLVVIRKELLSIFEDLDADVKDLPERTKSITDNLTYIIEKGLNTDPETKKVYDLFK